MEEGRRRRRRPRHLARRQGQLLGDGRDRPVRPVQRDPLPAGQRHPLRRGGRGRQVPGAACDCDRWVEIWNLVFMQFEQVGPGDRRPLPKPSVDTGMGLERLCAVLQRRALELRDRSAAAADRARRDSCRARRSIPTDYAGTGVSLRAIADHARAAAFLIADGVFPDKTGREYVLRRIMRRGIYHGWLLGIEQPFLHEIARRRDRDDGRRLPGAERAREPDQQDVPRRGDALPRDARPRRAHPRRRDGERAASKHGPGRAGVQAVRHLRLPARPDARDRRGARLDRRRGRLRTRDGRAAQAQRVPGLGRGRGRGRVPGDRRARRRDASSSATRRPRASRRSSRWSPTARRSNAVGPCSKNVAVVTAETPFYGEQGGQIGDTGTLRVAPTAKMTVRDAKRPVSTLWVHLGEVQSGELRVGDTVELDRRRRAPRRHPPQPLGDAPAALGAAPRAGRRTSRRRARWSRPIACASTSRTSAPLTDDEKQRVEDLVNERVRKNAAADTDGAADRRRQAGAARSPSSARSTATPCACVTMGESKEFCGGTHVARTGDIAFFMITEETGVAQGVRRIEAVTGAGALGFVRRLEGELGESGRRCSRAGQLRGRRARRQAAGRAARAARRRSRACAASWPRAAARDLASRGARRRRRARARHARRRRRRRRRCARSPTSCATSCARA